MFTMRRILEGVRAKKNLEATILYVDLSKAFDSMGQRPPKRNRRSHNDSIKNSKVKVHSPDGDTDYFNVAAGVLQ